jgi:hypothetical protein
MGQNHILGETENVKDLYGNSVATKVLVVWRRSSRMKFRHVFFSVLTLLSLGYLYLFHYYTNSSQSPSVSLPLSPPPLSWYESLLLFLDEHTLLKENVQSKENLWLSLSIPQNPNHFHKHALIYLGWCAFWNMEEYASIGGPSGEFIIWGDFLAGLAALGYHLTLVDKMGDLWIYLKSNETKYDIIVTDYDGLGTAENIGHFPLYHCRYYLIDGFGTQEAFNTKRHLDLKRILTPYPFDGSNSAINIVTSVLPFEKRLPLKRQGVIWSKDPEFLFPHLDTIRYLTMDLGIHLVTTFRASADSEESIQVQKILLTLPNITFLHFLDRQSYLQLLSGSMFLIGFGKPLDGPTPLEAMAHGCSFINPIFSPPFVHTNKPTRFPYTSQHPFVESHVPQPFAFTIDLNNRTMLKETIEIIQKRHERRQYLSDLIYSQIVNTNSNSSNSSKINQTSSSSSPLISSHTVTFSQIHSSPLIQEYLSYDYQDSFHHPVNYIKNLRNVLSNTRESKCLKEYKPLGPKPTPSRHPGNKVYPSFNDFIDDNCGSRCEERWIFRTKLQKQAELPKWQKARPKLN